MPTAGAWRAARAISAQKNNRDLITELAGEIDRETGLPELVEALREILCWHGPPYPLENSAKCATWFDAKYQAKAALTKASGLTASQGQKEE